MAVTDELKFQGKKHTKKTCINSDRTTVQNPQMAIFTCSQASLGVPCTAFYVSACVVPESLLQLERSGSQAAHPNIPMLSHIQDQV